LNTGAPRVADLMAFSHGTGPALEAGWMPLRAKKARR